MNNDVLHDIPVEYRDRFHALYSAPLVDLSLLRRDVDAYLATVRQVGRMVKLLDMGAAEKLATVSIALIDHVEGGAEEPRRLVQAAVRYFVLEEEDDEITGVLGFDDDTQVLNAVSRALGRSDLVVPLER